MTPIDTLQACLAHAYAAAPVPFIHRLGRQRPHHLDINPDPLRECLGRLADTFPNLEGLPDDWPDRITWTIDTYETPALARVTATYTDPDGLTTVIPNEKDTWQASQAYLYIDGLFGWQPTPEATSWLDGIALKAVVYNDHDQHTPPLAALPHIDYRTGTITLTFTDGIAATVTTPTRP